MTNQSSPAIKLEHIAKKYSLHPSKPTLTENLFKNNPKKPFYALQDINLIVNPGERVGIVGHNGSGKTTLLKIIAGITTPSEGKVNTNGKLVSLIETTAGFHPELTGKENITLNALLIGMSKPEIQQKMSQIIAFADIKHFLTEPMYTYSEGMKLRLGFAIAVNASPDILLLDENTATGDQEFRQKSSAKMDQFFKQGKTLLIVSHYLYFLRQNCDRIIWIKQGKIIADGPTSKILNQYEKKSPNRQA